MSSPAEWPGLLTPPAELLAWLHQQPPSTDPDVQRHWRTLRWLVLAELDRTAPSPASTPDFPFSLPHG